MSDAADEERIPRWRLVLGPGSEPMGELDSASAQRERALGFLYRRGRGPRGRGGGSAQDDGRQGGSQDSDLTVPDWINTIHELFPQRTVEILQEDALHRYGIVEVITNKESLERIEPSPSLLNAILRTKHLMADDVLDAARAIVRKVVRQLVEKLKPELVRSVTGRRDPLRRSRFKVANNFDPKATIRANLKHWSPERNQLVIREPLFVTRTRRQSERWQLIILVDQSGSMVDSVIHSAVTASIFHQLPMLKNHLIAFDTNVVDLTGQVNDPVEVLMGVQLGGGTDISRAMLYAEQLVEQPRRTMVVLISDLFEGGDVGELRRSVQRLTSQGTKVLVLGALDEEAAAVWNRAEAVALRERGAELAAMTPLDLADWVAKVVQ